MLVTSIKKRGNKRGQLWVETVIYTLIAFVMIGAVLAVVQPKIQELQDKALIDQSIGIMKDINTIFLSLNQGGPGNKRLIELNLKKGSLEINGQNDTITFELDSSYAYSEPGEDIDVGGALVNTKKNGDTYMVSISQNYSSQYNLTYFGKDDIKTISAASVPYQLFISNSGEDPSNKIVLNLEVG